MRSKDNEVIKKLKHREVERLRHHKLQKLISKLNEVIPGERKARETQCAILRRACDYVEFLIDEYNRVSAIIEVEGFSSQSTATSSQGKLVIDESFREVEQIAVDLDPIDDPDEVESKYPALPSSLLSPESYYDFSPEPDRFISQSWDSYTMDDQVDSQPIYVSQPVISPPPLYPIYNRPPENHVKQIYSHCRSCSCFRDNDYIEKKSYYPRDRLLTDTMEYPDLDLTNYDF